MRVLIGSEFLPFDNLTANSLRSMRSSACSVHYTSGYEGRFLVPRRRSAPPEFLAPYELLESSITCELGRLDSHQVDTGTNARGTLEGTLGQKPATGLVPDPDPVPQTSRGLWVQRSSSVWLAFRVHGSAACVGTYLSLVNRRSQLLRGGTGSETVRFPIKTQCAPRAERIAPRAQR